MSEKPTYLGEFEEIVLLAILRLEENAYGVKIRQTVEQIGERPTSIGAIYTTLDRLEKKGYVSSKQGEATAERGGRAKRYFEATGLGLKALRQIHRVRDNMLRGVDIGLEPVGGKL